MSFPTLGTCSHEVLKFVFGHVRPQKFIFHKKCILWEEVCPIDLVCPIFFGIPSSYALIKIEEKILIYFC